jgi:hypothetical protein
MGIISREEIDRMADALSEAGSSEPFLEMTQAIRDAPPAERVEVAAKLGRVERMEERLGELPSGMRISPRWFEDPARAASTGPVVPGEPVVAFEDGCGAVSHDGVLIVVKEKDQ